MVVEIIRNIAEYAIYSEKFNKNFMDNLIEQNVFKNFASILNLNNRLVNIQLIQTTSILLQNIKAEEKKCKCKRQAAMHGRYKVRLVMVEIDSAELQ